ncbi:IS3-like element ISAar46 family transposase, partial [Brevibacterium linens]
MTSAYRHLVEAAVPTRQAAALLGLSRTTIYRKPAAPVDHEPVVPPNKLCAAERAEILAALNSPEFVD